MSFVSLLLMLRHVSSLLKEKRPHRLDFLKALAHTFPVEPRSPCSPSDVAFARFTAEALGSLDYKTQEEVWLVVSYLNAALAVGGIQVLHLLEDAAGGGASLLSVSDGSPTTALPWDQRVPPGGESPLLSLSTQCRVD